MNYNEAFSRNLGIITEKEQNLIRHSCVAIPGLGGVGGSYALTMARLGVGKFHIADFDVFELANFNRQMGANLKTLGRPKVEVLKEMILDINSDAEVKVFSSGVSEKNIHEFLKGSSLVLDSLDAFAIEARRILYPVAEEKKIFVVSSGPLGMSGTLHVFGPGAMPFEEYFDFEGCRNSIEMSASFIVGVSPRLLTMYHMVEPWRVNLKEKRGPSLGAAIQLCTALASAEAIKILTGRGTDFLAPQYLQYDAFNHKLVKGRLLWGNRGPLQRIKRHLIAKKYTQAPPSVSSESQ